MMSSHPTRWLLLLALLLGPAAFAQTTQVTGTVTDADSGEPLPGVNIRVEATQIGTITNVDGTYQIALPIDNRTLIFTFVGYRTQDVEVAEGQSTLNVQLREDLLGLDEVVVTGLASSVKRQNLANSVETISARELAGTTTNQTLDGALSGKITGGVITSYTGAPGGGISVKLRGINTINGESQPLFVVDGVIASNASIQNGVNAVTQAAAGGNASSQDNPVNRIADLNPEDIESIEILKGASAAAIYGSRASNGVVIITTKKGQAGSGVGVSFSQSLGFTTIAKKLGTPDYTLEQALGLYAPDPADDATPDEIEAALAQKALVTRLFNENGKIDLEDQLYGNEGLLSTTNLSVSGGSERTQFYLSGQVKDDGGIIENTGYEKQSIRANVAHRLSRIANVDITTNYVRSEARRGITGNDNTGTSYGVALAFTPNFVDLTPDAAGNYPANPFNSSNPLQTRDLSEIGETTNRFITSGRLALDLFQTETQSVQFVAEAGADFFDLESSLYFPETLQFEPGDGQAGTSILGKTANLNYNWRGSLVHSVTLPASNLFFTTQGGFTGANEDRDTQSTVAQGLIGGQQNVDQANSVQTNQTRLFRQDRALYAQEEVNWADRVIGTVGVRADRSSLNGDPNSYFVFPKASLALNVAEFDFWTLSKVDQLKLRAAYGETGNTAPFGSRYTTFGPLAVGGVTGITINPQRGFENVEPERAREIEGGLDVSAFDGRVNVELTGYFKTITDLLLTRQVPNSTGFGFETFNGGELQNIGFEAGLTLLPVNTPRFRWTSRTSFWTNSAEVTELNVPAFNALGGGFGATLGVIRIEEGQSPTQIVGVDDRFIQFQLDANGDLIEDAEGNPIPLPEDQIQPGQDGLADGTYLLGDAAPDFQMSFYNDFQFAKRLTLTVFAHWKKGGDNINLTELLTDIGGTSPDYFDDSDGDGINNGTERLLSQGVTARPFVQDASYFKLRELGLYYDVPTELLGAAVNQQIRKLRVGFSANNLFTITPYKSYDPEVNNFADQPVASGVEVTPFPTSRSFLFHVAVGL